MRNDKLLDRLQVSEHVNEIGAPHSIGEQVTAILSNPSEAVLAIIIGIEGPAYRPLGASMVFLGKDKRLGSLSSGCIEADLSHYAKTALQDGKTVKLRYGEGSRFIDIRLPCGGGLDILLIPQPDIDALKKLNEKILSRQECSLKINIESGDICLVETRETQRLEGDFYIKFTPEIKFLVFGKGPEASTFASLVNVSNYQNILYSPDDETIAIATNNGCFTQHLVSPNISNIKHADKWTAIVLFFHDHDWEPQIILQALKTNAFYIGAQGSKRTNDARLEKLTEFGALPKDLARLNGPIGMIKSVRDARTLAVSVLAEILDSAL